METKLRYREDGTFKIVQFTDLHWQNGEKEDRRTRALIERVMAAEKPDLVVFTGDLIYSLDCRDPKQSLRDAVAPAERTGTPWAAVFGNHDSEGGATRAELMEVLTSQRHCLASAGPVGVHGVGNYALTVADRQGAASSALYFLDSGSYSEDPQVSGYDWIRPSQIEWYRMQSQRLAKASAGAPLPALAFFHIPLPEYADVWRTETCFGHRYEGIACPKFNSGLFAAMKERGDVMGTFCGHDHINDFEGTLGGIRLCYGRASGYHTYGRWLFARGARVIRLREGARTFETWLRLANGLAIRHPRPHKPRFARQGN
ncbi:metallophosphoesterase family protein [Cohnella nanjingensis]|uniref:Metallophosphoesterase family protein n=1 Tax=Cohnella nanjingensis TaxID=1387779 RepID=A0A7X0RZH6_9BACL|nr:metallophosphoesterase family protein [Cohnella nanjingensis]MBB6675346.1 metallophosphoesterase family protein [Cohnella nanjingensis]